MPRSCQRRAERLPTSRPLLAALVALLALGSCAGVQGRQAKQQAAELQEELERYVRVSDAGAAATPTDEALLKIAMVRDARQDPEWLFPWIQHPDPAVRRSVFRALGLIGGRSALMPLIVGTLDKDPTIQEAAAFGGSLIWSWPMSKSLARELHQEASDMAPPLPLGEPERHQSLAAVATARASFGLASGPDLMWKYLLDRPQTSGIYFLAYGHLCRTQRDLSIPRSVPDYSWLQDQTPVRFEALYFVAQCGLDPQRLDDIHRYLSSATESVDANTADWAWLGIAQLPAAMALPNIEAALRGDWPLRQRLSALRAAGELQGHGLTVLIASLDNADPLVAGEATRLLGESAERQAWDAILERLHEGPTPLGPAAALQFRALEQLATSEGPLGELTLPEAALHGAMQSPDALVRRAGFGLAIALAVQAEDETRLTQVLEQSRVVDDPGLPIVVARALSRGAGPAVEKPLLELLSSDNLLVAAIAVQGLADRGDKHITERLAATFKACKEPARWPLREALVPVLLAREADSVWLQPGENAHVRMARYEYLLNWQPSSSREAWGPPQARPLRRLSDAYFGVADVTGAKVVTSSGVLEVKLLPTIAPAAVRNFVDLAEAGFFDGQIFHQVVPGLIAETGDPHGTGLGGPGYTIRDEYSLTPFGRGSLGMARASKDKAGSRWFISQRREPQFDGRYTNFGQVTDGWAVLDHIRLGDTIESIVIQRRSQ